MAEERKKSRRSFRSLPRRAQNAAFASMRASGKMRSKSKHGKSVIERRPKIGTKEQRKSAAEVMRNMRGARKRFKTTLWKRADESGGAQMRAYIKGMRGEKYGYIAIGKRGDKYSGLTNQKATLMRFATTK